MNYFTSVSTHLNQWLCCACIPWSGPQITSSKYAAPAHKIRSKGGTKVASNSSIFRNGKPYILRFISGIVTHQSDFQAFQQNASGSLLYHCIEIWSQEHQATEGRKWSEIIIHIENYKLTLCWPLDWDAGDHSNQVLPYPYWRKTPSLSLQQFQNPHLSAEAEKESID